MEGASFLSSGRSIGYRSAAAEEAVAAVASNNTQKSLTPILDRFRALLKEREEEIRVSVGGNDEIEIPAPSADEIVELYEVVLAELTINSKPIITDLTIIAGEQREHGEGIADAICARIVEVPVEQKLPSLYLLDSIVKNIGREFIRHFSARLPEVFCSAYRQVHPNLHPSMRHLFGTWSTVFPSSVLRKIETQLQFSPSSSYQSSGVRASESPRPAHGIHVNPKYLEARHQLEQSTADSNTFHARTSTSKVLGKPAIGRDEYESENGEMLSSNIGTQMLGSTNRVGRTPLGIGHVKPPSPALNGFAADDSPRRVVEGASPSHSGYGCRLSGVSVKDEDLGDWRRSQLTDGTLGQFDSVVHGPSNRFDMQRPRALIDAYGTDERNRTLNHNTPPVRNMVVNGSDSKVGGQTWQNTEEEEFEWENMSPTLANRGRSRDLFSSSRASQGFGTNRPTQDDLNKRTWPNQEQFRAVSDPSAVPNNAVPSPDRGLKRKIAGFHNELSEIPVSHYQDEAWKPSQPWASQHYFNLQGNGVKTHMPFSATTSAYGQRPPSINTFPGAWRPSANMLKSQSHPAPPLLPFQKHIRTQFDMLSASNLAMKDKSALHQQQFDTSENRAPSQLSHLPKQQIPGLNTTFPPQLSLPQEVRPNMVPPGLAFNPSRPMMRGYAPQRFDSSVAPTLNPVPLVQSSMHLHGVGVPPLPPGPPPSSLNTMPNPQLPLPFTPNPPAGGALSGLFSSLVAQGLLSLTNPTPEKDSVGLEFDPDVLKARHESAITALYADLPRQCKTCGLRFKLQEEHSNHMDWHVTKNRVSKNRKQKPSRKWFANVSMWLSTAEALGGDSVPGFIPSENVVEKKDDEDMAVPADEDQKVCALCGELFDDFYSDETEEWMYRGAVYMNVPTGSTVGMDRSQLGPIVHAKCRSESAPDDFGNNRGVNMEEVPQRKQMWS